MFRPEIAASIASYFLARSPGRELNDLRLMKLFYLVERESIHSLGATLTGARFASLPNGPVLLDVLDLMRGSRHAPEWHDNIEFFLYDGRTSNHLKLKSELDASQHLSEAELELLDEVWSKYGAKSKWELVDLTHEFPEWNKAVAEENAAVKRTPIAVKDLLAKGFDMPPEEAASLADSIEYFQAV